MKLIRLLLAFFVMLLIVNISGIAVAGDDSSQDLTDKYIAAFNLNDLALAEKIEAEIYKKNLATARTELYFGIAHFYFEQPEEARLHYEKAVNIVSNNKDDDFISLIQKYFIFHLMAMEKEQRQTLIQIREKHGEERINREIVQLSEAQVDMYRFRVLKSTQRRKLLYQGVYYSRPSATIIVRPIMLDDNQINYNVGLSRDEREALYDRADDLSFGMQSPKIKFGTIITCNLNESEACDPNKCYPDAKISYTISAPSGNIIFKTENTPLWDMKALPTNCRDSGPTQFIHPNTVSYAFNSSQPAGHYKISASLTWGNFAKLGKSIVSGDRKYILKEPLPTIAYF